MKWAEVRKTLTKKLTRLSGILCRECSKKTQCTDESKCEKHQLINEILESLE